MNTPELMILTGVLEIQGVWEVGETGPLTLEDGTQALKWTVSRTEKKGMKNSICKYAVQPRHQSKEVQ